MSDFNVDTRRFDELMAKLTPRERAKLVRSALRRAAGRIKNRAAQILLQNLREVRHRGAMRAGIWTRVYKTIPGFQVAMVNPPKYYPSRMTNSLGGTREIPLALWLETGSFDQDPRRTRKGGYLRGSLPGIGFLEKAETEMSPGTISYIEDQLVTKIEKMAKKYE